MATVRPDGRPHVVVITFAVVDDMVVTAVDHKPKTTRRLQRLANIEAQPSVSFLTDSYDDDWDRLWWVRVDGTASIHDAGETHDTGTEALVEKYPQYRDLAPSGPVIAIAIEDVTSWSGTP